MFSFSVDTCNQHSIVCLLFACFGSLLLFQFIFYSPTFKIFTKKQLITIYVGKPTIILSFKCCIFPASSFPPQNTFSDIFPVGHHLPEMGMLGKTKTKKPQHQITPIN